MSKNTTVGLANSLQVDPEYTQKLCDEVVQRGFIEKKDGQYSLTEEGRSKIKIVLTGGVFDIIHPGHVHTLSASKRLGDLLVVSVARDRTVISTKGRPINGEQQRVELVGSLRCVDVALLGSETDIFETVARVRPDIIAIGYDQKHSEQLLAEDAKMRGFRLKIVRLDSPVPHMKSSSIVKNPDVMKQF
jgi:cytidyltransferase-like protein